jgi:hypothetical protein
MRPTVDLIERGGGKMKATETQLDSRFVAARVAMDQLEAMSATSFDVGVCWRFR